MRIAVGSDHAGLKLKLVLVEHLKGKGHQVDDIGTHEEASTDYPDWAHKVATLVADGKADRGVLCCGTGQGMAISANKVKGVRAACVGDTFSARMVAEHNDARVLCLGQRVTGEGLAVDCLDAWLTTTFAGGRHQRRVDKIEAV